MNATTPQTIFPSGFRVNLSNVTSTRGIVAESWKSKNYLCMFCHKSVALT